MIQAFSGLSKIHNIGYIHNDLGMPDNIRIVYGENQIIRVVILDFDISAKINIYDEDTRFELWTLSMMLFRLLDGDNFTEYSDKKYGESNVFTSRTFYKEYCEYINLKKNSLNKGYLPYIELLLKVLNLDISNITANNILEYISFI